MDDITKALRAEYTLQMNLIMKRCEDILKEEIYKKVYAIHTPDPSKGGYTRTYSLVKKIKSEIRADGLYIFIDQKQLNYKSNIPNNYDPTEWVPRWVNWGHHKKGQNLKNWYDLYLPKSDKDGAGFFESAQKRIERMLKTEFGIVGAIVTIEVNI